jgi:hypothetical protein
MIESVHRYPNEFRGASVTPFYYVMALNPRDWVFRHEFTVRNLDMKQIRRIEENLCTTKFQGRVKWEYMATKCAIGNKNGVKFIAGEDPLSYVLTIKFTRAGDAAYFKLRYI